MTLAIASVDNASADTDYVSTLGMPPRQNVECANETMEEPETPSWRQASARYFAELETGNPFAHWNGA